MYSVDTLKTISGSVRAYLSLVIEGFKDKGCQKSAAALTYMTLFAIVPLMTVTYSMFSIIPAFQGVAEQLQSLVFDHFVPDTGQEVQEYLTAFSNQARKLTVAGVAMLVVTAYLMLNNIEKTLNYIWGVPEGRKGLSSFLIYWAILSLGPILLGIGLVVSTYLISLKFFVSEYDSLGIVPWVLQFVPWVLTSAAFTLLFAAVPNCRVPIKHAFTGGVITAMVFELVKDLFSWIVSHTSFQVIYGAFAMVPLFLLWINLLWMIILGGAILVRTLSAFNAVVTGRGYTDLTAILVILWELHQLQRRGGSIGDGHLLQMGLETEQWQKIRNRLLGHKIIVVTQQGEYVLSRGLGTITLSELAAMVKLPVLALEVPPLSGLVRQYPWFDNVSRRLRSVEQHTRQTFEVSVAELFASESESSTDSTVGHNTESESSLSRAEKNDLIEKGDPRSLHMP